MAFVQTDSDSRFTACVGTGDGSHLRMFVTPGGGSHLMAFVQTGSDSRFTACVGTGDGSHLTAFVMPGGRSQLDQHGGHQGIGFFLAHQNLHNLQRELKACARTPTCDQLSILNNTIFRVRVATWKREKKKSNAIWRI